MDVIASRYAESLFALAKEENAVEIYSKDIEKISDVFEDDLFVQFFSHVSIDDEDKFQILKKSFQFSHVVSEKKKNEIYSFYLSVFSVFML